MLCFLNGCFVINQLPINARSEKQIISNPHNAISCQFDDALIAYYIGFRIITALFRLVPCESCFHYAVLSAESETKADYLWIN